MIGWKKKPKSKKEINRREANMSNTNDFIIENGVLTQYVGPGGDVVIPEGVTLISRLAFPYDAKKRQPLLQSLKE
jgi:hypothetical protein